MKYKDINEKLRRSAPRIKSSEPVNTVSTHKKNPIISDITGALSALKDADKAFKKSETEKAEKKAKKDIMFYVERIKKHLEKFSKGIYKD